MVRRVCRELGNKKNIIVINDEAHHCYRRKPEDPKEKLVGDDRKEAEKREEEARIWISGLEAVKAQDRRQGRSTTFRPHRSSSVARATREGTLFPWVVSDFSLIDAIESGIVKVPRVPVSDDSMRATSPRIANSGSASASTSPKRAGKPRSLTKSPSSPPNSKGAIQSLYGNYKKYYALWEQNADALARGLTPPVFIVVCNNTNVSKLVYDYISGWEKDLPDGATVAVPGSFRSSTTSRTARWSPRPTRSWSTASSSNRARA